MTEASISADLEGLLAALRVSGHAARTLVSLPGDVSPRRYARVELEVGGTAILALYPPEIAPVCARFARSAALLDGAGVRTPRILTADCAAGWMLVEDLGPETLGDRRLQPWEALAPYFTAALRALRRIRELPPLEVAALNPTLDAELLRRELEQTWEVFLAPNHLVEDAALAADLQAALDELCAKIAIEPAVPCHRDFMVRNLIPIGSREVAVLDHQDLRLGPPLYDLASLLNDTIFPPAEAEDSLLETLTPTERTTLHRTAAQRTLKAVGTYASFARRGATRHLPLIAPTLAACLRHLGQVPEAHALVDDLARAWSSALHHPPSNADRQGR